ncbi:MAG: hypothetical protein COA99_18440 [Moraxellaceae bacterium]|nr:MAG: hypothetical protein COA99_18440 [Moraxellaceae bacterium]
MIKKTLLAAAIIILPATSFADGPGCGLGGTIFEGQSGMGAHLMAVTFNGTSGNMTFAMTSGTSGCDVNEPITIAAIFLESNMDQIAENMATGNGETLEAFAQLLGVEDADLDTFATATQANFSTIFTTASVTSGDVLNATLGMMKQNDQLSKYAI